MHITLEQLIKTQAVLNQTLNQSEHSRASYDLFASMFAEQIMLTREHIEDYDETLAIKHLASIQANTLNLVHTKAESSDYVLANMMNEAVNSENMTHFALLRASSPIALSEHDDPRYICDEVLENTSFITQKGIKRERNSDEELDDYADNDSSSLNGNGSETNIDKFLAVLDYAERV